MVRPSAIVWCCLCGVYPFVAVWLQQWPDLNMIATERTILSQVVFIPLVGCFNVEVTDTLDLMNKSDDAALLLDGADVAVSTLLAGTCLLWVGVMFLLRWHGITVRAHDTEKYDSAPRLLTCAFYLMFLAIVGCMEYPYLWRHLKEEPLTFVCRFVFTWPTSTYTFVWYAAVVGLLLVLSSSTCASVTRVHSPTHTSYAYSLWASLSLQHRKLVVRKLFHLAAALMFIPPVLLAPQSLHFSGLAFAVAVKVLVTVELARALRIPPFGGHIHSYMTQYTDHRDAGVFVLTHLYLLLGCAVPVWMVNAAAHHTPHTTHATLLALAGVMGLGLGDAFAAIVGIFSQAAGKAHRWGDVLARLPGGAPQPHTPPLWARKTVQGSAGCAVAIAVGFILSSVLMRSHITLADALVFGCLGVCVALLETFCCTIDNIVVPLYTYICADIGLRYCGTTGAQ